LSPLIGLAIAFTTMVGIYWLFRRYSQWKVDRLFRRLQLVSAAAFSLGHGGNDAQKTMGIIAALLVGAGYLQVGSDGELPIPLWVVLSAQAAIALGTLSGGWRIVKTLGHRITALKPTGGFAAESAAAISLYVATFGGIPVSTTQTITGAIVGAGASRRLSAVRWGVARRVVFAWIVTIPAAGVIAAVSYWIVTMDNHFIAGAVIVVLLAAALAVVANRRVQRRREGSEAEEPVSVG
jgi:inorganic phosphate transporter, PiT family